MKKIIVPFAVAAMMIASCTKENTGNEVEKNVGSILSIDATIDEPITKGKYEGATGGKGTFSWAANDKIGVVLFSGTGYSGDTYNDRVAPFTYNTGTGKFDYSGEEVLPEGIHYGKVAFYPYGVGSNSIYDETNYNVSDGNLYVHLHKGRTYDANVQPIPVLATLGTDEDPNPITLKHIAAGVQITLTNVPSTVTKVELSEVSDTPQYITGWFTYPVASLGDAGLTTPADDSERGSVATYNLTNPGSTVTLTYPVPPLTTPKFKVDVYEGDFLLYTITSKAQASLTKGQILVMPALNVAPYTIYVLDEGLAAGTVWAGSRTIYTDRNIASDGTAVFGSYTYNKFILPGNSVGNTYTVYYKGNNNCEVAISGVTIAAATKNYYFKVNGFESVVVPDPTSPASIPTTNRIWAQSSGLNDLRCHMWGGTSGDTSWPGTQMTASSAKYYSDTWYYVDIPNGQTSFKFTWGDHGDNEQTGNLSVADGKYRYVFGKDSVGIITW